MATSSIFKNFVLDAEASKKFVELFLESEKNPEPLKEVKFTTPTDDEIDELLNEKRK